MFIGELRPFQQEAVEQLLDKQCLLLALHLGLGKTVCSIAAIEKLFEEEKITKALIICTASLKFQWQREIDKFAPNSKVLVIDGSPKERLEQYGQVSNYDYVIITYEQLINDWLQIKNLPVEVVVADECVAIKNPKTKRARRLKRLTPEYRFGLTGQPIENRPEELFSIMQWVDPKVLGRFDIFDRTYIVRNGFGGVQRYKNLPTLREKMSEAMYRKTREEVASQLPALSEETLLIDFDSSSAVLYRHIVRALLADLAEASSQLGTSFNLYSHYQGESEEENYWRGQIMSKMTCLRMLCDHPQLLKISADKFDNTDILGGSTYANQLAHEGRLSKITSSPKFDEAISLCKQIFTESPTNKLVLFSFFKPTLSLLQEKLSEEGYQTVQFHGGMNAKDRDKNKLLFQNSPEVKAFLSSDAGGVGIDLPQANYSINFDLPWSSGKLTQRNGRIDRISSEFSNITIINLLIKGSLEERQYEMLTQKAKISAAWLDGKGLDTKGGIILDLKTLTEFLKNSTV